jgi:hypothetical protein
VRAQKAPDILDMDVPERLGDERADPVGVALGWRRVEKRQNAAVRLDPVFGGGAAIAGLGKTDEADPLSLMRES